MALKMWLIIFDLTMFVTETASSSHIKGRVFKKNRIYCDQCDFSVSSIAVMVYHQKSHSHNLLAEKGNGSEDG